MRLGGVSRSDSGSFGTCTFGFEMNVSRYEAAIGITVDIQTQLYPAGPSYGITDDDIIRTQDVGGNADYGGGAPITVAAIESCGFTNVSNLVQNGADKTWATDDYIGFTFRGTRDESTNDYEFALKGVTNTVFVETNTNVPTPAVTITADAGADLTAQAGAAVVLSGAITGNSIGVVTPRWTQSSGLLENFITLTPTFTIPEGAAVGTVYTLTLTLTEQISGFPPRSVTDTMTVTVGETVVDSPTAAQTVAAITKFAQTRINSLISLQPDLLSINGDGAANVSVSTRGGMVDVATSPSQNAWLRLKGNWSTTSGAKNDYILGAMGTHALISENVTLGVMLQFDHMASVDGAETLSANGFLAGPYVIATLPDQPITFDGRLLFGKAFNSFAPLGTFVDRFDSQRMLAQFGVSGKIVKGRVTWTPSLRATFAQEKTNAYVDGVGTPIGATDTRLDQIAGGVEARFALPAPSGKLTITLGLFDVWTGGSSDLHGHRGKITAGMTREYGAGQTLSLTASYDGLGKTSYKSTSLDLLFQHRF
jgi:hypothetical protein